MKKSTIFMISFFVFALAGGIIYISYSASNFEEALKEGKYVNPIKGELRERKPINLIMNVWPGYGYPVIGIEKGFFEDQGVSVNIDVVQEYSDMISIFLNDSYDGFFGVYSDAILLSTEKMPLKVIYVTDFSDGADVIVSRPEIENVQDLKGKTISVEEFNSFSHLFVLALLNKFGLDASDVTIVETPANQVLEALESGTIDAGHTWEPTQSEALEKDYKLLITSVDTPGIITDVLVLKEDVVKNRPEEVDVMVNALFKSLKFMNQNPEEAHQIIYDYLGISSEELKNSIKWLKLLDREENVQAFTKSEETTSLHKSGEFISNFFVKQGVTDSQIDIDKLLEPQFIRSHEEALRRFVIKRIIISIIIVFALVLVGFFIGKYLDRRRRGK